MFIKRSRKNDEKTDYTKDSSALWFTLLMVFLAAYIIIDTLN